MIDVSNGRPIHRSRPYKFLKKIKKDLHIPDEVSISPHKFRHTYATECLNNGASLEFIRRTLGHTNITTTQRYLHLNTKNLQDEHQACNPMHKIRAPGTYM
ncbi:tyrosine-type recombinase/integrase [Mycoplasmatota bacterium WC44]